MIDCDWPTILVRNAAVCDLARALFKARGQISGGSQHLDQQPPAVRARYIDLADEILRTRIDPWPVIQVGDFMRRRAAQLDADEKGSE